MKWSECLGQFHLERRRRTTVSSYNILDTFYQCYLPKFTTLFSDRHIRNHIEMEVGKIRIKMSSDLI